jgi:Lon protease-like protein
MASGLPIFPLNVVLFPGAPLPLHIFEPRYREMLADCLAGDERFGVITREEGAQEPDRPGDVGCIAWIRANHRLPDGRSNIVVSGERRFVITEFLPSDHPYLVARVESFADEPGTGPAPETLSELCRLAEGYLQAMAILHDRESAAPGWAENAEEASFQVSAALELPLSVRMALLASRSTDERVKTLRQLLRVLAQAVTARAAVHIGARSNGKGGHEPVIIDE